MSNSEESQRSPFSLMSVAALGMVFGDIGTSPLYTFKTVLVLTGANPNSDTVLGSLSLIIWTLISITTIKYVNFAMRVDNNGEGGILALMSLLAGKLKTRPMIVAFGLIGAALIYGDGAITPAISVLSALEGLNIVTPLFKPYILPLSVFILISLFAVQYKGTLRIGKAFGPIMLLWFLSMGILGFSGILKHPAVLMAINPYYGMHYLFFNGIHGFLVLSGVFLCVTGAEALYADMGHFGKKPICSAWYWVVFPSLILNYTGQAALVLHGTPLTDNIFYSLCPNALLVPFVLFATIATIIASQSIITGAFSMTRQAIQLGWLPRLRIIQTSAEGYGQIYVGVVNWLLMSVTLSLVIGFGSSANLVSAYGIAVSATMLATSTLLYIAMREVWRWGFLKAAAIASIFLVIDTAFFTANLSKLATGGYIPIILAASVYIIMFSWHKGVEVISKQNKEKKIPMDIFMNTIQESGIPRVPGTAIFLTRSDEDTPSIMVWHVRKNHALHNQIFILRVTTQSIPWVKQSNRLIINEIAPNIWRATASYGFMEQPDIHKLLKKADTYGCHINLKQVTYYVGHDTIIVSDTKRALPRYLAKLFVFMQRNSLHLSDYFHLPPDEVVEIGRQTLI